MKGVGRGFSRIAGVYDLVAEIAFLGAIRRSQKVFLRELPKGARVLVVGGGTGSFLESLVVNADPREIYYVDISDRMIAKAQRRMQRLPNYQGKVTWIVGTMDDLPSEVRVDAAITYFFLDVFKQSGMEEQIRKISSHVAEEGKWLFADFIYAKNFLMRPISWCLIKMMYLIFKIVAAIPANSLPDFRRGFEKEGWEVIREKKFALGMIKASLLNKT